MTRCFLIEGWLHKAPCLRQPRPQDYFCFSPFLKIWRSRSKSFSDFKYSENNFDVDSLIYHRMRIDWPYFKTYQKYPLYLWELESLQPFYLDLRKIIFHFHIGLRTTTTRHLTNIGSSETLHRWIMWRQNSQMLSIVNV